MSDRPTNEAEERALALNRERHMRRREFLARTASLAGLVGLGSVLPLDVLMSEAAKVQTKAAFPKPKDIPIDTFVVLMMENRSFDHYFGWHPDADGNNTLTYPDPNGGSQPTHRLAPDFQGCGHPDPDHSWVGGRDQYDGGRLDGFLQTGNDEFALGYYLKQDLPFIPHVAQAFTLYDRYFSSLLGPTFANRYYQFAAQSGGQAHNNIPPKPNNPGANLGAEFETIFDRAIGQGLTARYYAHDQPFALLFGPRANSWIRPIEEYYADAASGNLPNIAFVDPPFLDGGGGNGLSGDEHPHGDIRIGQFVMSEITHAFLDSPQFRRGAMFINYDEWGGFFDHVAPRIVPDDRERTLPIDATAADIQSAQDTGLYFGVTGFRIPGVAISPYAKRGHVSHATVTHESILKMISYRFGLGYLNKRHRYASDIGRTFDFSKPDFDVPDLPSPLPPVATPCSPLSRSKEATAEKEEDGAELGSPEFLEYAASLGYEVKAPTADRIFPHPGRLDPEFKRLWDQQARQAVRGS